MGRRPYDTSRARCDVCGKPYELDERGMPPAVYTLADKYDEAVEDRDVLVSFRHWACHTPLDVQLANVKKAVDDASKKALDALDRLRRHL